MYRLLFPRALSPCVFVLAAGLAASAWADAPVPSARGDLVRLSRGEMLQFQGKDLAGAAKGQEFTFLQRDARQPLSYVVYLNDEGAVIAAALPADALEAAPPDGWHDLRQGVDAFRELRFADARRLLARASQDQEHGPLATALATRVNGALTGAGNAQALRDGRALAARQAFANTLGILRETTDQLLKLGHISLAVALDEGVDRLGAFISGKPGEAGAAALAIPASRIKSDDLRKQAIISDRAVLRSRQLLGLRKSYQAAKVVKEGLDAEPKRPELLAFRDRIEKDLEEAEERHKNAQSMRRFEKGAVHALTAIEHGLKRSADHPQLLALRKEMESLFEERTAPPVTPAVLQFAPGVSQANLEKARHLYTTRCTECHELELIDSRSMSSWNTAVSGMARRANLSANEQAEILRYLNAAQNGMAAQDGR